MVKALLKLANGTAVTLEGTPEEVKALLELYGDETEGKGSTTPKQEPRRSKASTRAAKTEENAAGRPDLNRIITLVKDCDEAESIEAQILDRTGQVDRTLLPLYMVHEHLDNAFGLTSGEINKITTDLGIPISQPNASRTLSGTASKYVIGDKVKVRGQAVRYKLSRRGVTYLKEILAGNDGG